MWYQFQESGSRRPTCQFLSSLLNWVTFISAQTSLSRGLHVLSLYPPPPPPHTHTHLSEHWAKKTCHARKNISRGRKIWSLVSVRKYPEVKMDFSFHSWILQPSRQVWQISWIEKRSLSWVYEYFMQKLLMSAVEQRHMGRCKLFLLVKNGIVKSYLQTNFPFRRYETNNRDRRKSEYVLFQKETLCV